MYNKAWWDEYRKRPDVIAKRKAYGKARYQRPEVKARAHERWLAIREDPLERKMRSMYFQRPEVKARRREQYRQKKNASQQASALISPCSSDLHSEQPDG